MSNPFSLTGKTILVTGASSGIGAATASLLGQLGARVILSGRDEERLQKGADAINNGVLSPYDLSDTAGISDWIESIVAEHGELHGVVHSAGVHMTSPVRLVNEKKYTNLVDVNLGSAVMLSRAFGRKGVAAAGGSLVFVTSVMGIVGAPAVSVYSATKAALQGLSKSLALEFAPQRIRVNSVAPGQLVEPMSTQLLKPEHFSKLHPLGLGEAADVANAIAFLVSDASRWVTGTTLVVDGGYTAQ